VEGGELKEVGLTEKHLESPGIHPDGKRIVYSAIGKSPATEVWVMENFLHAFKAGVVKKDKQEELNIRKILEDPGVGVEGAPSPDGKYLSFVDWETGDLAIYEIATGKKRRLTNKDSRDESDECALISRWSPDGKQIVYEWYTGKNYNDLRIIRLDGSKPRILYSNKEVNFTHPYDWSSDGQQILAYFEFKKEGETDWITQIVLVSTADGSVRVLKSFDGSWPENMCFSPDGRYIVYDFPQKTGSKERDIFLLSSDGIREVKLVDHPSHDELLGWAPDGKNIIFASDRNGTFSFWNIQIAEGKPQGMPKLVKSSIGPIKPLGFTRKGSFYYGISEKKNNIYITELNPETGEILALPNRVITHFEGYNQTPDYSPDGKYLAYISRRFPLTIMPDYTIGRIWGNVLCIKSTETGKEREIHPDLDRFCFPRWSPDGHSVIVMNSGGYYRIDTQTGKVTPILQPDDNIGLSEYTHSHEEKAIFYVRRDIKAKIFQIIVRDLESGTEKEIYRSDDHLNISLSPDGQWLAIQAHFFMSEKKPCLNVIPSVGGESRELYRFEEGFDIWAGAPMTWTADGKYILFTMKTNQKDDTKAQLYRIPAEGGEPEKLGLELSGFILNLSAHPDGRRIAFSSSEDPIAEIWVTENFLPE
jgi:Tol biopolymer transport system component